MRSDAIPVPSAMRPEWRGAGAPDAGGVAISASEKRSGWPQASQDALGRSQYLLGGDLADRDSRTFFCGNPCRRSHWHACCISLPPGRDLHRPVAGCPAGRTGHGLEGNAASVFQCVAKADEYLGEVTAYAEALSGTATAGETSIGTLAPDAIYIHFPLAGAIVPIVQDAVTGAHAA